LAVTTIIVPIVQAALLGSSVSSRTWIACVLALAGISIMGYDGEIVDTQVSSFSWPSLKDGDLLILGAAVVYSLHVVRLGRWANKTSPLKLVAYKALTELILSIIALQLLTSVAPSLTGGIMPEAGLLTFAQETGLEISTFFETLQERILSGTLTTSSIRVAVGAVLWTGLVSTAYTTFAQSFGQRRVKPAEANLIYSLQPIFTAVFAYFLLGETMGIYGFVGGSAIGGAVLLAASQSSRQQTSSGEKIAQ
jgi:drug/metabolite transporter (DMT)-like permease